MSRAFLSVSVVALLLGGCAHVPQVEHTTVVPHHRITKTPPAVVVTKPAIVAPVVVAPVAPAKPAKLTFKERWLSKFFRKRAVQQ